MWNWGELDKKTELPVEIKELLDQIVEKKIGYQPTIQVMQGLRAYFDPEYLKIEAISKAFQRKCSSGSTLPKVSGSKKNWWMIRLTQPCSKCPSGALSAGCARSLLTGQ